MKNDDWHSLLIYFTCLHSSTFYITVFEIIFSCFSKKILPVTFISVPSHYPLLVPICFVDGRGTFLNCKFEHVTLPWKISTITHELQIKSNSLAFTAVLSGPSIFLAWARAISPWCCLFNRNTMHYPKAL